MSSIDLNTLKKRLNIIQEEITITQQLFNEDTCFVNWLGKYYSGDYNPGGNSSIEIVNASYDSATSDGIIVINGKSNYLNCPNLDIKASFSLSDEKLVVQIQYSLSQDWKFSNSFPNMPVSYDFSTSLDSEQKPLLDYLDFKSAYFILSTTPIHDENLNVDIDVGLNFVGQIVQINVNDLIALISQCSTKNVTLHGTIRIDNTQVICLDSNTRPWNINNPVPGLMLKTPISDIDIPDTNIKLRNCELNIYSPVSQDWLYENGTHQPCIVFSGTVPELKVQQLTSELLIGVNELLISAQFTGFNLQSLEDLINISGKNDLSSYWPDQIQSKINKLELERVAIDFIFDNNINVSYTLIEVGIPNVQWNPVSNIEIDSIKSVFVILSPLNKDERSVDISLEGEIKIGDVPLILTAEFISASSSFFLQAELKEGNSILLSTLIQKYLPNTYLLGKGSISIDYLVFNCVPGHYYSFTANVDQSQSWTIQIFSTPISFSNISLNFNYDNTLTEGNKLSGYFEGTIDIDSFKLTPTYNIHGPIALEADFPDINILGLINSLDSLIGIKLPLPNNFDIKITSASLTLTKQPNFFDFAIAATAIYQENTELGNFAFYLVDSNGKSGFTFGFNLNFDQLETIPVLGNVLKNVSGFFLELENLSIVFSSVKLTDSVPFNSDSNDATKTAKINVPTQTAIDKGFSLYAQVDLAKGKANIIAKFLKITSLKLTLSVHIGASDLMNGSVEINLPTCQINSYTFLTGDFVGSLPNNIRVDGHLTTKIRDETIVLGVQITLATSGALLTTSVTGSIAFGPIKLSNVGILLGIDEAELPSFGFSAQIDGLGYDAAIALIVNTVNPRDSGFLGAISNISLSNVVKFLSGANNIPNPFDEILPEFAIKGIDQFTLSDNITQALISRDADAISKAFESTVNLNPKELFIVHIDEKSWSITDWSNQAHYIVNNGITVYKEAQVYCVFEDFQIGDLKFPQGFHMDGNLDILGATSTIKVEINKGLGILIEDQLSPIVFPSEGPKILKIGDGNQGPSISLCTYSQKNSDGTTTSPHFYLKGKISLLDIASEDMAISISKAGFSFYFVTKIGPMTCTANATIPNNLKNFSYTVDVSFSIDESIDIFGKTIHIVNFGFDNKVTITVDNDSIGLSVGDTFTFEGATLKLDFSLTLSSSLFSNLEEGLRKAVITSITNFLTGCPIFHASSLLASTALIEIHPVVNKMYTVPHGEVLMYHSHIHKSELEKLIQNNTDALVKAYVVKHFDPDNRKGHMTLIIEILDLIYPEASKALKKSIDRVMPILEQGYGTNLNKFLDMDIQVL